MPNQIRLAANVDADGTINYINRDYIEWLGYRHEEILGQKTAMLRAPDVPAIVQETIREQMLKNIPIQFPIKEKKKNGELYWAHMAIQPIFEGGKYIGYTSIKSIVEEPEKISEFEKLYEDIRNGKLVFTSGNWVSKAKHNLFRKTGWQRASLLTKSIISLSGVSAFVVLLAFGFYETQKANIEAQSYGQHAKSVQTLIEAKMDKKYEIGITNAIGITFPDNISRAAAEENQLELLVTLASAGGVYKKFSNFSNIKLHLVNEQGISYLKSWKPAGKQVRTDMSQRAYVQQMLKEQKPMTVQALSSAGYNLKALVPIFHNERFEGFVEFIQGVGSIRRDFEKEKQFYLAAMSVDYALKGDKFRQKNAKNNPVSADGKWVVGNNKHFSSEMSKQQIAILKQADLNRLFKQGFLNDGSYFHVSLPIYDAANELMGYHIFTENSANLNAYVDKNVAVAFDTFKGIVLTVLIMLVMISLLLWFIIINPIKNMQKTMLKAVEETDLFARIRHYSKDELGLMALAYNKQSTSAQCIIAEANAAMEELVAGRLDYRIRTPFQSDFDMLKNRINQTCESLEETFKTLKDVMGHMQKGDFQHTITHDLKGEYGRIVDTNQEVMQDLYKVFAEINQVMSMTARGNLDERIANMQQGDVLQLQTNINQSLELLQSGFAEIVQASERIAQGDFTQSIDGEYEFALAQAQSAINQSMESLSETLNQIRQAAFDVNENVYTVAEGTQSLNDRTQEQAASLEETSAAMEQTTSQIRSNLENTKTAASLSQQQSQRLKQANEVMTSTKESMHNIQNASNQIRDITGLIDSIAFQTNLLALNAAVEAARAGEHGRGFAVVAGEVRNLASKSADATKQIGSLIETTSEAISVGVEQVDRVGESLDQVTQTTQEMAHIINEVETSSNEQAVGVEEINKAIGTIDSSTQQNAALVEETTASTESMRHSAEEMQRSIEKFKLKH